MDYESFMKKEVTLTIQQQSDLYSLISNAVYRDIKDSLGKATVELQDEKNENLTGQFK